MSPLRGSVVML